MSTTFDIDVRAALERRRGDWKRIAKESGVSYSWLSKFANHKIANPGFDTLKAVHAVTTSVAPAPAAAAPETAGLAGNRRADPLAHDDRDDDEDDWTGSNLMGG